MKILICDDSRDIILQIEGHLEVFSKNKATNFEIIKQESSEKVIAENQKYDIAFVDIEMPVYDGLDVTRHLQTINPNIIVFIITSYQGYLDEAMDLKVFRYISKPIDEQRFMKSMEIAFKLYRQATKKITITGPDGVHNILTNDILYFAIDKRKTRIVTKNGNYTSYKSFEYWKNQLSNYDYFAQPHYSFLVNLENVTNFSKSEIILSFRKNESLKIPVSRGFYKTFKADFYRHMGENI